jgi:DNA invertase Pin-like site-specific DNA recombinase
MTDDLPADDAGLVPAIGYLRLSDARLEEAFDGRRERLKARAEGWGWSLADEDIIVENDMLPPNGDGTPRPASAWKRKRIRLPSGRVEWRVIRPGFRLLLDLIPGRPRVIAEDLDRLLRQPRDGEDLIDAVEMAGATVRSLSGSINLTSGGTEEEKFVARIMAANASKGSGDISRRVRNARALRAGKSYGGGRRPYGYRADEDAPKYHKRLLLVPAEAEMLRAAAGDILDRGISLKAVARDLRDRRAPTVTGTAEWSAKALREVLLKPAVAGLAVRDGAHVPAPDVIPEPVLDADVWERLRDLLTDPARRTNTSRANEPRWLVSGFAVCGVCGGPLRASGGRNRAYAYIGAECCHVRRGAANVDTYVGLHVVERMSRPDGKDLLRPPPRRGTEAEAGRLRGEARRLRARRERFKAMAATGDLDPADVRDMLRGIDGRLEAVAAELTAAASEPDPLPEFRDQPADEAWAGMGIARRRAVVQALIRSVTVLPAGRRGAGFDPATVEVTPRV